MNWRAWLFARRDPAPPVTPHGTPSEDAKASLDAWVQAAPGRAYRLSFPGNAVVCTLVDDDGVSASARGATVGDAVAGVLQLAPLVFP